MTRTLLFLVLAVTLAGCAATTPIGVEPEPTIPTEEPTAEPTGAPVPQARRAVYQEGGALFLYDVADDSVQQLTEPAAVRQPRWVGSEAVSFIRDAPNGRASALMQLDLRTRSVHELFRVETGLVTYGWRPDQDTVAYVTVDEFDYPQIVFRSVISGTVRPVATLSQQFGRERVDDDQFKVEFSPGGTMVLVVYTAAADGTQVPPEQSPLQVRTALGDLVFAADARGAPTMGLWARDGSAVYFRINQGARAWRGADGTTNLPGRPFWYSPTVSPNGRLIAFDTGASDPSVRVRLLNLRTGELSMLSGAGRALPVFATGRTVWAQRVRACTDEPCFVPGELVNEVYAIDVRNGNERRLTLRSLADIDVLYGV